MIFYVGTKLSQFENARAVMAALQNLGHEVSADWTAAAKLNAEEQLQDCPAGASLCVEGVRKADAVIILLAQSAGTLCELGGAVMLGKPVILVHETAADLLKPYNYPCVFYYSGNVFRVEGSIDDFITQLPEVLAAAALALPKLGGHSFKLKTELPLGS